jgi:hypothetical protein
MMASMSSSASSEWVTGARKEAWPDFSSTTVEVPSGKVVRILPPLTTYNTVSGWENGSLAALRRSEVQDANFVVLGQHFDVFDPGLHYILGE